MLLVWLVTSVSGPWEHPQALPLPRGFPGRVLDPVLAQPCPILAPSRHSPWPGLGPAPRGACLLGSLLPKSVRGFRCPWDGTHRGSPPALGSLQHPTKHLVFATTLKERPSVSPERNQPKTTVVSHSGWALYLLIGILEKKRQICPFHPCDYVHRRDYTVSVCPGSFLPYGTAVLFVSVFFSTFFALFFRLHLLMWYTRFVISETMVLIT